MTRSIRACLAAAALALFAAGAASAAPKEAAKGGEKVCAAGVGTYVCCKAAVANHCGYVTCCEKGNAAFFKASGCGTCAKHTAESQRAHHAACGLGTCESKAKSTYVSCCEEGNGGFFKGAAACCSHKGTGPSCCAADAKKK